MSTKSKSTVKLVSFIMIITLFGKVLGLFRDQLFAWNYGTAMDANAFLAASRIPRLFFDAVFASAVSSSFIPIFNEYLEKKNKEEAFRFSNNFISIVIVVTTVATVVGILFAPWLQKLFVAGYDAKTALRCIELLRVLFPMLIFTGVAFSFVGVLQSLGEFTIPAAMSVVSNGIIIVYYFLFGTKFGVNGLAIAFLLGWLMQALIQIPPLYKRGYRFHFGIRLSDPGLKKVGILMFSVMVSTWIQPINIAINGWFASFLFDGIGSSIIEYANNLYSIIVGVFVLSVANVIFPELSKQTAKNDTKAFGNTVTSTIKALSFLLLPMMIGLMALSGPIIKLIYEWKNFDSLASALTSRALFFFSMGMFGFGIQTILSRAFYAIQDAKTPLITGIVSIVLNFILCNILVGRMNVGGLALASALSSTASALLLIIPMQKRNSNFITRGFLISLLKMVIAALCMGAGVVALRFGLDSLLQDSLMNRMIQVGLPALFGIIIYMITTYLFHLEESRLFFNQATKLMHRFKR